MDTIKCMEAFIAVATSASFTEGGKKLAISTKLASKYVQQLEERLGAKLLYRTTRSITLTDIGKAYYQQCIPLLEQFDELEGLVQQKQSDLAGTIKLTAPTGFGSQELTEAISSFQLLHPKVSIDLHLSDNVISIVESGIDLAIRFGRLEDSTLIARKLLEMRMVVVASPTYLSSHGTPKKPSDLANHNCLLLTTTKDFGKWSFVNKNKQEAFKVNGSFHSNSPRAIANMALNGVGVALCPIYVVKDYVEKGLLTLLFENNEESTLSLYAVYPSNRHLMARIRALIDHITEYYDKHRFLSS